MKAKVIAEICALLFGVTLVSMNLAGVNNWDSPVILGIGCFYVAKSIAAYQLGVLILLKTYKFGKRK